jgi:DNA-binding LytR/AlgR family response regulator
LKILIADDQKHARSGLKALLSASMPQPEIWEAAHGRVAQHLATEMRPDLVLMDIRMPEVDGLAAAAGADGFVSKGEGPETLLARMAELGFPPKPAAPSV